jgi:hypothetical protein
MSGAIPPLLNTPSWCGAQLKKKHRNNFTCVCVYLDKSWKDKMAWCLIKHDSSSWRSTWLRTGTLPYFEKINIFADKNCLLTLCNA